MTRLLFGNPNDPVILEKPIDPPVQEFYWTLELTATPPNLLYHKPDAYIYLRGCISTLVGVYTSKTLAYSDLDHVRKVLEWTSLTGIFSNISYCQFYRQVEGASPLLMTAVTRTFKINKPEGDLAYLLSQLETTPTDYLR
jgi:hypothetical protein